MNLIAYKYIARTFLYYLSMTFISISGIVLFFDAIELFKASLRISGLTTKKVIIMVVLRNYYHANKVWPFVILLSSLFTYRKLSRHSEIDILRAAGFSTIQLIFPVSFAAFIVGLIHLMLLNPLGATAVEKYQHMESTYLEGRRSMISFSDSGLWLKQKDVDSKSEIVFHALRISQEQETFHDVTFLYNASDHEFLKRIDAKKTELMNGYWLINDAQITDAQYNINKVAEIKVPTDLTFDAVMDSILSPEILSFWQLLEFLLAREKNGITSLKHQMCFGQLILMPLCFASIIMLGYAFGIKRVRDTDSNRKIAFALLLQLIIYFASDFVFTLSVVGAIPVVLGSLFPFIFTSILGFYMMLSL